MATYLDGLARTSLAAPFRDGDVWTVVAVGDDDSVAAVCDDGTVGDDVVCPPPSTWLLWYNGDNGFSRFTFYCKKG